MYYVTVFIDVLILLHFYVLLLISGRKSLYFVLHIKLSFFRVYLLFPPFKNINE